MLAAAGVAVFVANAVGFAGAAAGSAAASSAAGAAASSAAGASATSAGSTAASSGASSASAGQSADPSQAQQQNSQQQQQQDANPDLDVGVKPRLADAKVSIKTAGSLLKGEPSILSESIEEEAEEEEALEGEQASYKFSLAEDGDHPLLETSDRFNTLLGLNPNDLETASGTKIGLIRDRIHPNQQASFQEAINAATQTENAWEWEGLLSYADGSYRATRFTAEPTAQPDGSIVWEGILQDLTEMAKTSD